VALTLVQYNQDVRPDKMTGSLVMMLDDFSPVFNQLPFESNGESIFYDYERVATLPARGWRAFNTGYVESTGTTDVFREYLKVFGGESRWERQLANKKSISKQTRMSMLACVKGFDLAFFKGSPITDPNSMVGLYSRIGGNQLILNASGGGALTLAKLNDLIDAVPFTRSGWQEEAMKSGEGIEKVLWMRRTVRNKIDALMEAQTGSLRINYDDKDSFGRRVESYRGAVIKVVEEKGTGSSILNYDEDPGDGTADCTSIICAALGGSETGLLRGLYKNQSGSKLLDVKSVDHLEAEPRGMIRWDGMYGIAADEPRCIARLHGITNS
jgi:hypothetical protein